ncbi:hypothetical protein GCM10025776_23170 [Corallincola platygyrae]
MLFSAILMLHLLPGFNNQSVWEARQISVNAVPHSLNLNFDKLLVGVVLLPLLLSRDKQGASASHRQLSLLTIFAIVFVLSVVTTLAVGMMLFDVIGWDPKLPRGWYWFVALNIGITVVAEESLFRGLLQQFFTKRFGIVGVLITTLLFGLVHLPGGLQWLVLSTIAGAGYGLAYYYGRSILAPIAVHAALNLTHFFLFTYPMKA